MSDVEINDEPYVAYEDAGWKQAEEVEQRWFTLDAELAMLRNAKTDEDIARFGLMAMRSLLDVVTWRHRENRELRKAGLIE